MFEVSQVWSDNFNKMELTFLTFSVCFSFNLTIIHKFKPPFSLFFRRNINLNFRPQLKYNDIFKFN